MISFHIDHEHLLEKYKGIWIKTEDLNQTKLNTLPVYDDRYIKTKISAFGGIVYTNFRGLNKAENDINCEFLTVLSVDSLLVYHKKYYLQSIFRQLCFWNCKQTNDRLYWWKSFRRLAIISAVSR